MGNSIWDQYTTEHNIQANGMADEDNFNRTDEYFLTFFEETAAGQYVPSFFLEGW